MSSSAPKSPLAAVDIYDRPPAETVDTRLAYLADESLESEYCAEVEIIPRKVIMLAGLSGCGKTTVLKTLLDKNYVPGSDVLPTTTSPLVNDIQLSRYDIQGNVFKLHLTVLDTPGLLAVGSPVSEEKNPILMKSIADAIMKDLVAINMVMICHRLERTKGTITNEDIKVMEAIMDFVGEDGKENCGILLTGCENCEDKIGEFIFELRFIASCKRIADFVGDRIYAMGANVFSSTGQVVNGSTWDLQQSVHTMRNKMIESIFYLPDPVRTHRIREVKSMMEAERDNFVRTLMANQTLSRTRVGGIPRREEAASGFCVIC
jgi:hypothetical protein